jgi:hypothetical protein
MRTIDSPFFGASNHPTFGTAHQFCTLKMVLLAGLFSTDLTLYDSAFYNGRFDNLRHELYTLFRFE